MMAMLGNDLKQSDSDGEDCETADAYWDDLCVICSVNRSEVILTR